MGLEGKASGLRPVLPGWPLPALSHLIDLPLVLVSPRSVRIFFSVLPSPLLADLVPSWVIPLTFLPILVLKLS